MIIISLLLTTILVILLIGIEKKEEQDTYIKNIQFENNKLIKRISNYEDRIHYLEYEEYGLRNVRIGDFVPQHLVDYHGIRYSGCPYSTVWINKITDFRMKFFDPHYAVSLNKDMELLRFERIVIRKGMDESSDVIYWRRIK